MIIWFLSIIFYDKIFFFSKAVAKKKKQKQEEENLCEEKRKAWDLERCQKILWENNFLTMSWTVSSCYFLPSCLCEGKIVIIISSSLFSCVSKQQTTHDKAEYYLILNWIPDVSHGLKRNDIQSDIVKWLSIELRKIH